MNDDKRQRLIVRQSQMTQSIEYCKMMGIQPTAGDLFAIVEAFTSFIYEEAGSVDRAKRMDEYLKNKYNV